MKKGMEKELLMYLIIALVGLAIMGYGVKTWADTIKYGTDKEACKQSIQLKASTKLAGGDIFNIPLKCSSRYRFIKNEKDFEKAKETLANDMYDCWDQFGKGEIDFLENYNFGFGQRYCFICSKINFDDSLKGRKVEGLGEYLTNTEVPLGSIKYSSFIFPEVNDEIINQIYKERSTDAPLYVIFYADKGFNWEKTPTSAKEIALVYTGAGCIAGGKVGLFVGAVVTAEVGGIGALVGAPAGCVIGAAVSGGRWFFTKTKFGYVPMITLGSSNEVEKICNSK